jgi:hypothetical protein
MPNTTESLRITKIRFYGVLQGSARFYRVLVRFYEALRVAAPSATNPVEPGRTQQKLGEP